MRTLLVGVIAGVLLSLLAVPLGDGEVSADNPPHVESTGVTADSCAGCHRAHTAQAEKILLDSQPDLCYSCHGTGATGADTDVENGIQRGTSTALKAGGFLYARINTTDATADTIGPLSSPDSVTSSHTVDGSSGTLWGNGGVGTGVGGTFDLRCGACHDPHGNGRYRILRPDPDDSGGAGQGVTDEPGTTRDYDTANYFDVSYVSGIEISGWCSECHTRYLAPADSAETALSGDSIFTYRHESDGGVTDDETPSCIQCHASHGTNAETYPDPGATPSFSEGVPWPDGTSGVPENSRLLKMDNRGICQKCH